MWDEEERQIIHDSRISPAQIALFQFKLLYQCKNAKISPNRLYYIYSDVNI